MRTRFHSTSIIPSRSTQGVQRKVQRPRLSKEARAAINARRRKASNNYKNDIDDAWAKIDEVAEGIAVSHHKSVSRVQSELHMGRQLARTKRVKTSAWNAFCWKKSQNKENNNVRGKEVLQQLIHNHQDEYNSLTNIEQKALVQEFEEHKATLTKARRISTKARINDVTHTLAAVENELNNLKSRSGVEVMLFAMRGTTDMPLKSVAFATGGVENFLEGAMKTDTQDFLGKMEGFAVQGVRGAAKNHQQRVSAIRTDIRNEVTQTLRAITGDDGARMEWKHYWRNIVKRYQVIIEGWPKEIPFRNLSEISSGLPDLETLLRKWHCGKIYWKNITKAELQALCDDRDNQIENGEIEAPSRRRRRSDYGKKRSRQGEGGGESRRKRQKSKVTSVEAIDTDDDQTSNDEETNRDHATSMRDSTASTTPQPSSSNEELSQPVGCVAGPRGDACTNTEQSNRAYPGVPSPSGTGIGDASSCGDVPASTSLPEASTGAGCSLLSGHSISEV